MRAGDTVDFGILTLEVLNQFNGNFEDKTIKVIIFRTLNYSPPHSLNTYRDPFEGAAELGKHWKFDIGSIAYFGTKEKVSIQSMPVLNARQNYKDLKNHIKKGSIFYEIYQKSCGAPFFIRDNQKTRELLSSVLKLNTSSPKYNSSVLVEKNPRTSELIYKYLDKKDGKWKKLIRSKVLAKNSIVKIPVECDKKLCYEGKIP